MRNSKYILTDRQLGKMLTDAFNEGFNLGIKTNLTAIMKDDGELELPETFTSAEIVYNINGKEYKQMTLGDIE